MRKSTKAAATIPQETYLLLSNLSKAIELGEIRQIDVSKATGVNQGQVSRILSGQIHRVSPNVFKICKYAEKVLSTSTSSTDLCEQELTSATLRLWNGTQEHAELLLKLLAQLHMIQVAEKR